MQRKPLDPRVLALVAVMTAIVLVLTSLVRVPTPGRGYIHLGDTGVFFSAFAFGPLIGGVSGGLGTALADILGGYPQWAVFSLLIHGFQGWMAGVLARRRPGLAGLILAALVGAAIVVVGYFLAGLVLSGLGAAVADIPANILQVAGGAVVAVPLFLAVRQAYPPLMRFGGQRQ